MTEKIKRCSRCENGKLYFIRTVMKTGKIPKAYVYGCNSCGRLTFEFCSKEEQLRYRYDIAQHMKEYRKKFKKRSKP